jgi:hypothetical protein
VRARGGEPKEVLPNDAAKKVAFMARYSLAVEMLRSMIDHRKVLVLALNGPAVGGGAAWFPGVGKHCVFSLSLTCLLALPWLWARKQTRISHRERRGR